jgi:hypothetical protein
LIAGHISYFREGCTPISLVDQKFLDAKEAMRNQNRGKLAMGNKQ